MLQSYVFYEDNYILLEKPTKYHDIQYFNMCACIRVKRSKPNLDIQYFYLMWG